MATVPRVEIITRSEWGAAAPGGLSNLTSPDPDTIVVHHTAQGYTAAAQAGCSAEVGKKALRDVQASHFKRRFSDVGYHFLIDGAGRVYQGRSYGAAGSFGPGRTPPVLSVGSHVRGHNRHTIGVCVLGCFGAGAGEQGCNDTPSDAAVASLARVLAALSAAYDIPLTDQTVIGHRDLAATACPGTRLYSQLPTIRKTATNVPATS